MPSYYKVTLGLGSTWMGASESYYSNQSGSQLWQAVANLAAARAALAFQDTYFTGVRVGLVNIDNNGQVRGQRSSFFFLPGTTTVPGNGATLTLPGRGTMTQTSAGSYRDQWRSVLQWLIRYNANTSQKIRYMSGIPDDIIQREPTSVNSGVAGPWWTAWGKWQAELKTEWNILARQNTGVFAPTPVTGLVLQQAAPGLVGVQVLSTTAPAFQQGLPVALKGFRPAKGKRASTMNGKWIVDSIDTTSSSGNLLIYLRGSAGIDPSQQRITGNSTIQNVGYAVTPINYVGYVRAGIHKRGRPLGSPRGRRLIIPSLDP